MMQKWVMVMVVLALSAESPKTRVFAQAGDAPRSLAGTWSYVADPDGSLKASDISGRIEKGDMKSMPVPSNWSRHDPDLLNYNGVVWFARSFSADRPEPGDRLFLQFDGIDYEADVFVNGKSVGRHVGYFEPFRLDITDTAQAGENLLVVRVQSPLDEGYGDKKTLIKGILVHHDCRPGSNSGRQNQNEPTGGIWNDVKLIQTGPLTIENVRVHTERIEWDKDAPGGAPVRAHVVAGVRVRNRSAGKQSGQLAVSIGGKTFKGEAVLAGSQDLDLNPGALDEITVRLTIDNPRLWWTWDLGRPDLYNVSAILSAGDTVSENVRTHFGIRTIEFDDQTLFMKLNGRRIFHKGSNYIATQWLSTWSRADFQKDIDLMKGANLNAIRVHAHVLPHVFYDLADEAGVLVWADFALIWGYDTGEEFSREALRQYRAFIDGWYNHPSIWLWCAHNEGSGNDPLNIRLVDIGQKLDPTRVHLKNSGKWPPGPGGWDEHEYAGWYSGKYLEFADKKHQFVTEYGAQAVPSSARRFLASPSTWPPDIDDWRYHDFQPGENIRTLGPLELFQSLDDFIGLSQKYQYDLVRFATEAYRRAKYAPCGGIYHFMFTECWPSITWAVVDHERAPKLGYEALRDAMAPVIVSLEVKQRDVLAGDMISVPVWVVSDKSEPIRGWRVRFGVEGRKEQWADVNIGADAAAPVATLKVTAPKTPGASVRVFAELVNGSTRISSTAWEFLVVHDPYQLGNWTFRKGDDMAWAKAGKTPPEFKPIRVPGNWENDGYPDYDGYGWYRAEFVVPASHKGDLKLFLGPIDDVDELYVNGEFIGRTGTFPPDYQTAWTADRNYTIPEKVLRPKQPNVIAIRVYDSVGGGGPYRGPVRMGKPLGINLVSDQWKLKLGDDPKWSDPGFDDRDWPRVRVPANWDDVLGNVDGFGWYRFTFDVNLSELPPGPLTLVLGSVDDVDATYLNGAKIGQTGEFPPNVGGGSTWNAVRRYPLSREHLKAKGNVLAVRVYDGGGGGGIWQGPVEISALDLHLRYRPVLTAYSRNP